MKSVTEWADGSPRISIIIPTHNGARFLPATVAGVRAQTVADWELVLVDDASRPEDARLADALACADPRIRLVRRDTPGGWGPPARNTGFAAANPASEFVVFLDHDDVWEPFALEALMTALEANPSAVGAHGAHRCIDAQGTPIEADGPYIRMELTNGRLVRLQPGQPTTFGALVPWNCIRTPGLALLRRAALPPADPFPLHEGTGLDWDLWLNLARKGEFAFVNRVVLNYRVHDANATHNHPLFKRRYTAVRRRLWEADGFTPEQRRLVRQGCRAVEWHWLRDKLRMARYDLGCGAWQQAGLQCRYAGGHLLRLLRGRP